MYEAANFIALNKLRGFTPRQQRLLELEAVYHSTQYHGLPSWEQEVISDDRGTRPLCGHEREPRIKAGIVEEKVETIIDMLVGEGRFPDLDIADKDLADKIAEVKLSKRARGPARDLVVKGSGPLECGVLEGDTLEAKHLRPEWCEPVFVAKVGRPRARELADELGRLGVALRAPRSEREHLWTPDGARSEQLAFLRYEYVFHDEEAASSGAKSKVSWRHRIDFTPTCTVYYEDQITSEGATQATEWKVAEVLQHNWGIVPVAWSRTPDAEDGEPEGPSLITEAFRSIAEAADRVLTRKDASVSVVSNPKAYTIDLEDMVANINAERGLPTGWRASSSEVLSFSSAHDKEGQIGLLEPTGKGPEAAKNHYDDLVREAARVSRVLAHDPQTGAGVASGIALQRMMEPTVQRVGTYRIAVGELLEDFVRIAAVVLGRAKPKVTINWPPVIRPTAADLQATAQALSTATGGAAVLSQATGVRLFGAAAEVDDPAAEVAAVEKGAEEAMRQAREAITASGSKAPPLADEDEE